MKGAQIEASFRLMYLWDHRKGKLFFTTLCFKPHDFDVKNPVTQLH